MSIIMHVGAIKRYINYGLGCRYEGFGLMCMYVAIFWVWASLLISILVIIILILLLTNLILYRLILMNSIIIFINLTPLILLLIIHHLRLSPLISIITLIFMFGPFFILIFNIFLHYLLFARIKSQNFFTEGLFGSVSKTKLTIIYSFCLGLRPKGISYPLLTLKISS